MGIILTKFSRIHLKNDKLINLYSYTLLKYWKEFQKKAQEFQYNN